MSASVVPVSLFRGYRFRHPLWVGPYSRQLSWCCSLQRFAELLGGATHITHIRHTDSLEQVFSAALNTSP